MQSMLLSSFLEGLQKMFHLDQAVFVLLFFEYVLFHHMDQSELQKRMAEYPLPLHL